MVSDEVDQLAQVIRNASQQGGVSFVNGVTVAAVVGNTVSVDIGGQTVTAFVPASIPSPLAVGTQVRLSVEGAVRTVDAVLAGSSAVMVPIGGIIMWPSATAPTGGLWGICDGATFSGSTFAALAAVLGGTTLPDLRDRMPRGASSGGAAVKSTGGSATISTSQMPEHDHAIRNQVAGGINAAAGSNIAWELIGASTAAGWYTGTAGDGADYWPKYYAVNSTLR